MTPRRLLLLFLLLIGSRSGSAAPSISRVEPLFKELCFDCHGDKKAKAGVNLQQMLRGSDFGGEFKHWEKVIEMVGGREMPPEEKPQPSDSQRREITDAVRAGLDAFIAREAGDPGRVAMRQLTTAEYAYTIKDLTGLELGLEKNFVSDAVGGEGFSNVGDVQFIQDSMLERYLEAAKVVASHAIVGAEPLRFYRDPGKTGQEIAAVRRIQEIYRGHGFRTASGEGGNAFGLERYPKAFFAAWKFLHRRDFKNITLEQCAKEQGIDARFAEYIWNSLNQSAWFPSSEIAAAWRKLPRDADGAREGCEKIYGMVRDWQTTLAENPGDAEVAAVLTETSFKPTSTNGFRVRLAWPKGTFIAVFKISAASFLSAPTSEKPVVRWQGTFRFRPPPGATNVIVRGRPEPKPLRAYLTDATLALLNFGESTNEFVTTGAVELPIEFKVPDGMGSAELTLLAKLDVSDGGDGVVRCVLSHDLNEGATVAATGTFSTMLANPFGAQTEALKFGVAAFARAFPQISQREADPADRDPIPAPFDNDYNNAERNEFHAFMKYHRDDRFLTEHILDDATRAELDQAWADLLTSFDYHNTFLRFVVKKFGLDLPEADVAKLTTEKIDALPSAARPYVKRLHDDFVAAQNALRAAEPKRLEETLHFAELAWRRPLTEAEKNRLSAFYKNLRDGGADHPDAIRGTLARILVAPGFLYRMEPRHGVAKSKWIALSDSELASRLSYFLWSSVPDAQLSRVAAAGKLKNPDELARQARRMLHDAKARRFATEFFGQWFGFYRFDNYRGVDTKRFPEFTDTLKSDLYEEAISFFDYIVRNDRPVNEILFADYSFLNRNLASHYAIERSNLETNRLTKIESLDRSHRGGLLRLGAPLIATSAPLRTSGVKRGDWVLRRVLGKGVPPPPGDAGSIPPDDILSDGKTVRQRLEAHRSDPTCANCHARFDALGFALEHFDSLGRWRETYRDGQRIDASGTLNDGTEIAELDGLMRYLKTHEDQFQRTLCAKLLGYALGRAEMVSDRPLLKEMMEAGGKADFSSLVTKIVTSPQFRNQRAGP